MMWTSTRILSTTLVLSFILHGGHLTMEDPAQTQSTVATAATAVTENSLNTTSETQQVNSTTQQLSHTQSAQISQKDVNTDEPETTDDPHSFSTLTSTLQSTTFMSPTATPTSNISNSEIHSPQHTTYTKHQIQTVTAIPTLAFNDNTTFVSSMHSPTLLNTDHTTTAASTTTLNITATTTSNNSTYVHTSEMNSTKELQKISVSPSSTNAITNITQPSNPSTHQSKDINNVSNQSETVRDTTIQTGPTTATTFYKSSGTTVFQKTRMSEISTEVDQVNKMTTSGRENSMQTTERINSVTMTGSRTSGTINGSEFSEDLKAKICAKFLIQNKMGKCNMRWVKNNDGTINITSINIIVDAAMANQLYSDLKKEKRYDADFPNTLVAIVASCGSLMIILLGIAVYCACQRKSYRKNQQPLTEELQTVENGYHDNPTLEVMEVQPEMPEKKLALNGEFNDSWIVPFDNLTKDDIPDEEDTHL